MKRIVVSIMIGAVGVCLALGGYMLGLHNGEVWTTAYYEEVAETEEKVNEKQTKKEEVEWTTIGEWIPVEDSYHALPGYENMEDVETSGVYYDSLTKERWFYEYNKKTKRFVGWQFNDTGEMVKLMYYSKEAPDSCWNI